jgi:hypothetical protein
MRTFIRRTSIIAAGLTLAGAATLSATPALAASGEGCPNEQVREESNIDPATDQPYSAGLSECRAYEMVSPLEKQAHGAEHVPEGFPVAPGGNTVGYASEGDFAEPENFRASGETPRNVYLAHRRASGWITESALVPATLVALPSTNGLFSDFSVGLEAAQVSCGIESTDNAGQGRGLACAERKGGGAWTATPTYASDMGGTIGASDGYLGASADLSRVFFQPEADLLPSDALPEERPDGIYELSGIGTSATQLQLVNVDNQGNELGTDEGGAVAGPSLGDFRENQVNNSRGTAYHAISANGRMIFFEAMPAGTERLTLYARTNNGAPDARTIDISDPAAEGASECSTCNPEPQPATFEGAAADGSKAFFTTSQQLLNSDTDATEDLYEYDLDAAPGKHLIQISRGGLGDLTTGAGAQVQGVVRSSANGQRVYYVARGVSTTLPNGLGQTAEAGAFNLYAYDTETGQTKFVALLSESDSALWGREPADPKCHVFESCDGTSRPVQLTPSGEFLVFGTFAHLRSEDTNDARAAYRYDYDTGELTWLSHGAPGFAAANQNRNANIEALPGSQSGAAADVDDWNRAISETGEYVIFTTSERLQADDQDEAVDVYLWHNGAVSLISDGEDREAQDEASETTLDAGISGSGSDIFFFTDTRLVQQDRDDLQDLYDARIDGGFPAPPAEPTCSRESCQGAATPAPILAAPGTAGFAGGGNLTPGATSFPPATESKPKPLTRAQELAKALGQCKRDRSRARRASCDKRARARYGAQKKRS